MPVKYPCNICNKAVATTHKAIQCDLCDMWVHIKCNRINNQTYQLLQNCNASWYCYQCIKSTVPFSTLTDCELYHTNLGKKSNFQQLLKVIQMNKRDLLMN